MNQNVSKDKNWFHVHETVLKYGLKHMDKRHCYILDPHVKQMDTEKQNIWRILKQQYSSYPKITR